MQKIIQILVKFIKHVQDLNAENYTNFCERNQGSK